MIRIVVVDDQTLVRTGIRSLLALKGELEVVGEASDGVEALEIIAKTAPDVVLLDIRMPRLSGIEVLKELQAKPGMPAVLLLSTFDDDDALLEGMRFGAKGFLLKDVSLERLVESIKAVVVGGTLFRPGVTERNLASIKENQSTFLKLPLPDPLTSREKEVLALGCPEQLEFVSATRQQFSDRAEAALFACWWAWLLGCPEALLAAFAAICLSSGALIPAPPAIGGAPSTGWTAQTAS